MEWKNIEKHPKWIPKRLPNTSKVHKKQEPKNYGFQRRPRGGEHAAWRTEVSTNRPVSRFCLYRRYNINMNNGGHRISPWPCQRRGSITPKYSVFRLFFSNRFWIGLWMFCGSLLNSTCYDFLYLLHRFFEHGFCIVFSSMLVCFCLYHF